MSFEGNVLSSEIIPAPFEGGRALPVSLTRDFETGGIGLNDPSKGLNYQIWNCKIKEKEEIIISAENTEDIIVYQGSNITECSLTFDQNMRPAVAFVEQDVAKLRWYDSQASSQVVTTLGSDIITPRVSMDDKRYRQSTVNDIILAYLRSGNLYFRLQRDRFGVEYLLQPNVQSPGIIKIGMNRVNRFQFLMRY